MNYCHDVASQRHDEFSQRVLIKSVFNVIIFFFASLLFKRLKIVIIFIIIIILNITNWTTIK